MNGPDVQLKVLTEDEGEHRKWADRRLQRGSYGMKAFLWCERAETIFMVTGSCAQETYDGIKTYHRRRKMGWKPLHQSDQSKTQNARLDISQWTEDIPLTFAKDTHRVYVHLNQPTPETSTPYNASAGRTEKSRIIAGKTSADAVSSISIVHIPVSWI